MSRQAGRQAGRWASRSPVSVALSTPLACLGIKAPRHRRFNLHCSQCPAWRFGEGVAGGWAALPLSKPLTCIAPPLHLHSDEWRAGGRRPRSQHPLTCILMSGGRVGGAPALNIPSPAFW